MIDPTLDHFHRSVNMIHESLRLPTSSDEAAEPSDLTRIDEENERRFTDDDFRTFRVPVTLTRQGFVRVFARDAAAAESITKVMAGFADDIQDAVQTEQVGTAIPA